jgi:hypothetical protein
MVLRLLSFGVYSTRAKYNVNSYVNSVLTIKSAPRNGECIPAYTNALFTRMQGWNQIVMVIKALLAVMCKELNNTSSHLYVGRSLDDHVKLC